MSETMKKLVVASLLRDDLRSDQIFSCSEQQQPILVHGYMVTLKPVINHNKDKALHCHNITLIESQDFLIDHALYTNFLNQAKHGRLI